MLDTHEAARDLTAAGMQPDHVNGTAKADLTAFELRLVQWMIGVAFAAAGLAAATLRLIEKFAPDLTGKPRG